MSSASTLFSAPQRTAPAAGLFGATTGRPAGRPQVRADTPRHSVDAEERDTFAGQFRAGTHAKAASRPE